jgi:hypothetical protein
VRVLSHVRWGAFAIAPWALGLMLVTASAGSLEIATPTPVAPSSVLTAAEAKLGVAADAVNDTGRVAREKSTKYMARLTDDAGETPRDDRKSWTGDQRGERTINRTAKGSRILSDTAGTSQNAPATTGKTGARVSWLP